MEASRFGAPSTFRRVVEFRKRGFVDVGHLPLQVARMPVLLRGKHVLVVDDEPDVVDLIEFVVVQAGATVRTARGAHEALSLLAESAWVPDVLLLDIGMPDMNGYDLLLAIRRQDGLENVPAVAVTGFGYTVDKDRAFDVGFSVHVTKPFKSDVLVDLVRWIAQTRSPAKC
jgi:CheY-like chemotaxis protein